MNKKIQLKKYIDLLEKYSGKKVSLKEMPIQYSDDKSRMNKGIEKDIASKRTAISDNPALPKLNNEQFSNYEELLASSSFKRAVNNLKKYTGLSLNEDSLFPLQMQAMQLLNTIQALETKNRSKLEKIAIALVMKEMGLEEGEIEFRAKLVNMQGQIDLSGTEDLSDEEKLELEEKLFDKFEDLDLEVGKRRFINSLTQGASVKAQNMHELVKDQLDKIDKRLYNLYGVMMSANEALYWILPDKMIDMAGAGNKSAGKMEVEPEGGSNGIPLVIATAVSFPALVHELVKGVMEVYSLHGQGDDIEVTTAAIQLADSLSQEKWDLRLGPALWETFREMFPDELFEDDKRYLEKYLIINLYKLPAQEFNEKMKLILAGKQEGKQFLQDLLKGAVEHLSKEHLGENDIEEGDEENV